MLPEPTRAALRAATAIVVLVALGTLAGCPIRRRPPPWQREAAEPAGPADAPPAADPAPPAPVEQQGTEERVTALAAEVAALEQRWASASSAGALDPAEREALLAQIDRLQSEAFALQEVSQDDALYSALDALTVLRDDVVRAR